MRNVSKSVFLLMPILSMAVLLLPLSSLGQDDTSMPLTPEQLREEGAYLIGVHTYIYGCPVVEMYWMRYRFTSSFGFNRFYHRLDLESHLSSIRGANNDTLYSIAWVDLSQEPVILHVPDTQGRYYVFQLIDFFTNTFNYVGKRVTGTREGDYAIVGPGWKGSIPSGIKRIDAPTNSVFIQGRMLVDGPADLPNVNALQDQYLLTSLNGWGKKRKERPQVRKPLVPPKDHWTHPLKFFQILNVGLGENPPPACDNVLMSLFKWINVGPGQSFDIDSLDPAIAKGLERAMKIGKQIITTPPTSDAQAKVWQGLHDIGSYGSDYILRAAMAMAPGGIGVLTPEEGMYFVARVDHEGKTLSGKYRYRLRFEKGGLPPVDAFWSVTIYKLPALQLVENPIDRYSIGDRRKGLKYGPGGSLEITIQNSPPEMDHHSNWLPAPKGNFSLILRAYMPRREILEGRWIAPPVIRIE